MLSAFLATGRAGSRGGPSHAQKGSHRISFYLLIHGTLYSVHEGSHAL
jgi:hypothetical protein